MIPLAFNTGEAGGLVRPIGQTIVGGMTMSTFMSLFLVPILYESMNRPRKKTFFNKASPHKSLEEKQSIRYGQQRKWVREKVLIRPQHRRICHGSLEAS